MEDKTIISIVALIILVWIASYAMYLGVDGAVLAGVVGILAYVLGLPSGIKLREAGKV